MLAHKDKLATKQVGETLDYSTIWGQKSSFPPFIYVCLFVEAFQS